MQACMVSLHPAAALLRAPPLLIAHCSLPLPCRLRSTCPTWWWGVPWLPRLTAPLASSASATASESRRLSCVYCVALPARTALHCTPPPAAHAPTLDVCNSTPCRSVLPPALYSYTWALQLHALQLLTCYNSAPLLHLPHVPPVPQGPQRGAQQLERQHRAPAGAGGEDVPADPEGEHGAPGAHRGGMSCLELRRLLQQLLLLEWAREPLRRRLQPLRNRSRSCATC